MRRVGGQETVAILSREMAHEMENAPEHTSDDVGALAERRMRGDHIHRGGDTISGPEQLDLLFQITPLLTGEIRNRPVGRAPCAGLMTDHARSI